MKYLFFIISMAAALTLSAQDTRKYEIKPEKGDAQIVVNSQATLIEVAQHLMDNGYQIEKMDTLLNYVNTSPRQIPGINGEFYLNIVKKGGQYKVVGMARFNFTASLAGISSAKGAYEPARFTKSRGSDRRVFDAAYAMAESIGTVIDLMK